MSNGMKSDRLIVIDDDESRMDIDVERSNNVTFADSDSRQTMEIEAERSNSYKSDPLNPDSDSDLSLSQHLTHTITAILGSIHGMSSGDVNKLKETEKGVIAELHNAIETVSKVFENSSNKGKLQKDSTNILENISINNEILKNLQRIKRDYIDPQNNKVSQKILQQNSNGMIPESSRDIALETLSSETRLQTNHVRNQKDSYVDQMKDKQESKLTMQSSGVKVAETSLRINNVYNQKNSYVDRQESASTIKSGGIEVTSLQVNLPNQKSFYVDQMKGKQEYTSTIQSSGSKVAETSLQVNNAPNQTGFYVDQMKGKQESTSTIQSSGSKVAETSLQVNNAPNQTGLYVDQMKGKQESTSTISSGSEAGEASLQVNNVPYQTSLYVDQMKGKQESRPTMQSSGIKIGDNWELPIIVLDSDDDENEVIEIDSEEEEIQEFREMMSLEDIDCIEIGKDEFENSRKVGGENENTNTEDETEDEVFIPVMPGVTKKRRRSVRLRKARRRAVVANPLKLLSDDDPSKWRKDLPAFPIISNVILRTWATGFLTFRKEWERLEYLGDKVLMFCVLRFATTKYLRYYSPSDIKVVTTFLVSNKLLAAYSLTLGLDKQNQMQGLGITKKVADAFEAYIGAYYLSDGEAATTRYLDQLMSPLFELVLSNIQTGRDPHKIMNVMANYFNMGFLIKLPKLSR